METKHQYILEKGSRKYHCPNCHKKTFVYYIDTETGDYLPHQYGRCDREGKCSYHLNPYLDGYVKTFNEQKHDNLSELPKNRKQYYKSIKLHFASKSQCKPESQPQSEIVYFDFETFRETLEPERYEKNTFIQNLFYQVQFPFQPDEVTKVIQLYRLGTVAHGYRSGSGTFPFIDMDGNIRAIQVKQFDETNHTTGTDFLHSIIEKHCIQNNKPLPEWLIKYHQNGKKVSCLFGEHLLAQYPLNPVALVEAPKTAVYGTLYFGLPESFENLIWLAVYNKSSFSLDKLKVLKGRDVFTFPDLSKDGNTFKEWEAKAKEIEKRLPGTRFIFSDLLEQLAPDRDKNEGNDIADYLIIQDWRLFRKQNIQETTRSKTQLKSPIETQFHTKYESQSQSEPQPNVADVDHEAQKTKIILTTQSTPTVETVTKRIKKGEKNQPEIWNKEISDLENFFTETEFPDTPIKLNSCSTIVDVPEFIKSHLSVVKANNGKRAFSPYLSRLRELKQILILK
ncbi:DUF6965 family protein [Chryseobacterium sp. SIMBA_029]|uniref:DUF6965 family protein n=1 Tax=Chryseobacterium sp. SIMBA_029 TaxID=3085772 RepID=UPI003979EF10